MKTTIVLGLILAAGFAQAAPRINISTKTGLRMTEPVECPSLPPMRQATITTDVIQYLSTTNPQDGSVSFQNSILCDDLKNTVNVYEYPEDTACYSLEQKELSECLFVDSSGKAAKAVVFGGVFLKKDNTKTFSVFLSTMQNSKYHFEANSVTVFDPSLEKILLYVNNRNLGAAGGLIEENITAQVLIEDKRP